jgi:hypothetical protein
MASREPPTLTSAEVHALAERLRSRATSVMLHDAPSQQSDGLLAAGALVHLVAKLQTLVRSIAPRRGHPNGPPSAGIAW